MREWSMDFVNDPMRDYDLIGEIWHGSENVAFIFCIKDDVIMTWYSHKKLQKIPLGWMKPMLIKIQQRLSGQEIDEIFVLPKWGIKTNDNDNSEISEIFCNDVKVASVINKNDEVEMIWSKNDNDLFVSLKWLIDVLNK